MFRIVNCMRMYPYVSNDADFVFGVVCCVRCFDWTDDGMEVGCVGFRHGVIWDEVDIKFASTYRNGYGTEFTYVVGDINQFDSVSVGCVGDYG